MTPPSLEAECTLIARRAATWPPATKSSAETSAWWP